MCKIQVLTAKVKPSATKASQLLVQILKLTLPQCVAIIKVPEFQAAHLLHC